MPPLSTTSTDISCRRVSKTPRWRVTPCQLRQLVTSRGPSSCSSRARSGHAAQIVRRATQTAQALVQQTEHPRPGIASPERHFPWRARGLERLQRQGTLSLKGLAHRYDRNATARHISRGRVRPLPAHPQCPAILLFWLSRRMQEKSVLVCTLLSRRSSRLPRASSDCHYRNRCAVLSQVAQPGSANWVCAASAYRVRSSGV